MKRLLLPIALILSLLGSLFLLDPSTRTDVAANAAAVIMPSEACAGGCAEADCPGSGAVCCEESWFFGLKKIKTYEKKDNGKD